MVTGTVIAAIAVGAGVMSVMVWAIFRIIDRIKALEREALAMLEREVAKKVTAALAGQPPSWITAMRELAEAQRKARAERRARALAATAMPPSSFWISGQGEVHEQVPRSPPASSPPA